MEKGGRAKDFRDRDGERREILEFLTYSLAEKNLRSRFRRRRNG